MSELDPLPEDWKRALAVVAHPDDLEYGPASAVARWTDQGKQVVYYMVTSGEAVIDSMAPDECARLRQEEERRSATIVGVQEVEFMNHPDGLVEASVGLRRDIAAAIRRHRPEVLISINFRESFGMPGFNHADHRATGIALIDAARDAGNRWLFVGAGPHRTYLDALPEGTLGTDPDAFLRGMATETGPRLGVEAAVAFEVIPN